MKYELQSTETFDRWFAGIEGSLKTLLLARLARIENGNFGDHKALATGLSLLSNSL